MSDAKNAEEFAREVLGAFQSLNDPRCAEAIRILEESVKRIDKYGLCPFADHFWENRATGSTQDAIDSFHGWVDLRETMPV
jgi:hypothetical protein